MPGAVPRWSGSRGAIHSSSDGAARSWTPALRRECPAPSCPGSRARWPPPRPQASRSRRGARLAGVDTVVVLMGHATLAEWTSQLIAAGRDPETPAACVEQGTTPAQRVISSTLGTIAEEAALEGLGSPMVVVVGVVAARAAVPSPVAAC